MASPKYNLTVIKNRNWGTVTFPSQPLSEGEVAILSAEPNEGYSFCCWSDGSTERTNHRYVMPAKDVVVKAYFFQTNPFRCLIDLDGLASFWTKIKSWFAEKSTASISGAKQIGFCKTGTTYNSEDVQGALTEVKAQSDTNSNEIVEIKRDYIKRDMDEGYPNPYEVGTSFSSFARVTSGAFMRETDYYSAEDNAARLAMQLTPCRNMEYVDNETYYEYTENVGYTVTSTSSATWETDKDKLYCYAAYSDGSTYTFKEWITRGLYKGVSSSGSSISHYSGWSSTMLPEDFKYMGGMPHSGYIMVNCGFNTGHAIYDDTAGILLARVNAKGKYGSGGEFVGAAFIKGHIIRVELNNTVDGGNGAWDSIVLSFFGD